MAKEKTGEASKDDKFFADMRERFNKGTEFDSTQRNSALDDIRFAFVPGNQWDEPQKKKRKQRPAYEFNRIRQAIRQVTGDQRQNRPAIKIRAVESNDQDTAETLQGLIKNIEATSNAERAYDTAFQAAVSGGFGAFQITTEYASDSTFDQNIIFKEIRNQFSVTFDPAAQEWDRRDGEYAFVSSLLGKSAFEQKYPGKEVVSFDEAGQIDTHKEWFFEDQVRVAEYWVKEPATKEVVLLSDGRTVEDNADFQKIKDELAAQGITEVRRRTCRTKKISQYIVSGKEILEGPYEWVGKFIPIVPVWGDMVNVGGEERYSGMVRFSRDAQKLYNFNRTTAMETVAKAPKAPYIVTPAMLQGHQAIWDASSGEDFPYLPVNVDPTFPGGIPKREPGPEVPMAMVQMLQLDAEDLKATTGIYDASLGAKSNETSGRAILARQKEGNTATFEYIDNLSRAIKFAGEILVDLIPKIYDTARSIRILGQDGGEKWVHLYQPTVDEQTGQTVVLNDLSTGQYDVTATAGPSFATQRMEMADSLMGLTNSNPQLSMLLADLIVGNLDMPGSEEVKKRIRMTMIKQGVLQPENEEEAAAIQQQADPMQQVMQQRDQSLAQDAIKQSKFKTDREMLVTEQENVRLHKLEDERDGAAAGATSPLELAIAQRLGLIPAQQQ